MKLYTVLMYNFNNYEVMREPEELDPECEYIYVTDNQSLKSTKWKIVVDESLNGLSAFDKCYRVRFNLFKYASTPICIYVDGSIQIHKSLRPLYNAFIESKADVGLNVHPERSTMDSEYQTWVNNRNYPRLQKEKCYIMFQLANYNTSFNGLYQGGVRICRNTDLNQKIDSAVFNTLVTLGTNGHIERLDQTIYSFILNKYFNKITIFPFSQQVFQSAYMTLMHHNTNTPRPYNRGPYINQGYVFNKPRPLFQLK